MKIKKIDPDKLPVYEITIDDEDQTGIQLISLVENPAIGMKGMAFHQSVSHYFKQSEDKQIIIGPALIPDLKIRRTDEDGNEYFVVFSKQTIEKMVEKFNRTGSNRRINIDHTNRMVDAFIVEDWIVEDPVYDKSKKYGFEVPVGTYMIKVKVEDKDFWMEEVKELGKFGFSIEGLLNQMLVSLNKTDEDDEVEGIDDLDLIDLFDIFQVCTCQPQEFAAKPGLVHPNCKCELMLGSFQKSAPYIGKDGKEYPCPICDEAQRKWQTRGFFRDVFGTRYTYIDRFPYFVRKENS